MWVICISCHHAVEKSPIPRNRRLKCTACGSVVARVVRVIKMDMLNGGQMPSDAAKTLTHAGLISIAHHRGYKKGWAAVKYKKIYGVWPDGDPPPENPSGELTWWIRQQGKEYAKMMRGKESAIVSSPHGENAKSEGSRADVGGTRPHKFNPTGGVEETLMSKDDYEVDL